MKLCCSPFTRTLNKHHLNGYVGLLGRTVASMGVPTDSLTSTFTQSLDLGCFKHLETCVSLLALGKFPLDKIAFLLFLDVVKWFSLDNTSAIYIDTVKK